MSGTIWDHLHPRQAAVEAALRAALARHTAAAPPRLAEAMAYSLLAPGKRLRPLLAVLACEAAGGTPEPAPCRPACAVEMVHTYSLIHDDLPAMDDDDLRRGLPTCHKKFGEALAILAGDALLTAGVRGAGRGLRARGRPRLAVRSWPRGAGAAGMVGGQVLDLKPKDRAGGEPADAADDGGRTWKPSTAARPGPCSARPLRLGVYAAQAERPAGPTRPPWPPPTSTRPPSGWRSR